MKCRNVNYSFVCSLDIVLYCLLDISYVYFINIVRT